MIIYTMTCVYSDLEQLPTLFLKFFVLWLSPGYVNRLIDKC